MKKIIVFAMLAASVAVLPACTDLQGQNVYNAQEVGKQADIEFGKILSVKKVKIQQEQTSGAGAIAGAAGGGVAGSQIGNGNGSVGATIAGALIGGIIGNAVEKGITDHIGVQYIIRKENGKTVSITQNLAKDEEPLKKGQRVMIQTSGEYQKASNRGHQGEQYQRVLPAD